MKSKYTVYWYKLPTHTNINTEGYIGITNNLSRRKKEHKRNAKKASTHFYNAINKYTFEALECIQVHSNITVEEASELEYSYRPSINIGWNSAQGGIDTLKKYRSTPISLYHKDDYTKVYTFSSIAEASNQLMLEEGRLVQARHRKSMLYGNDGWAILYDTDTDRSKTLTIAEYRSKMLKGIKRESPSHFKGISNRWSLEERERIGKQHKGKVISEAQKESMRIKNRKTNPSCKEIHLKHVESDTIYKYHSISEASRQLNIPLSTLKYRVLQPLPATGKDGWTVLHLGQVNALG